MESKFILTRELGKLARWLRLLGYDAEFFASDDMKKLFIEAFSEGRVIITKRQRLANFKTLKVLYIKSDKLGEQISILKKKVKLDTKNRLFTRCADCNREVFKVRKASVQALVPEYVFKTQKNFFQCPKCSKIFWKATHWDRAKEFLSEVRR